MSIGRRNAALEKWWVETYPDDTYGVQILQAFHAGTEYEQDFQEAELSKSNARVKELEAVVSSQAKALKELKAGKITCHGCYYVDMGHTECDECIRLRVNVKYKDNYFADR